MKKYKMFLINLVLSAAVGALMQITWALVAGFEYLTLASVANMMFTGTIVGTVSLFCIFQVILKFNTNLKKAIVINIIIMVLLLAALYVQTSALSSSWKIDAKWLVVLVISETAGISLTIVWYKQIKAYSRKLEMKKASLRVTE